MDALTAPRVEYTRYSERTMASRFRGRSSCDEVFVLIRSKREPNFAVALKNVLRDYLLVLERQGLSQNTQVLSRYVLSDIQNQKTVLFDSELFRVSDAGAYSIIGQPPGFRGGGLYFLGYHITGPMKRRIRERNIDGMEHRNALRIEGQHYTMIYAGAFSGSGDLNSARQTNDVFNSYNALLHRNGMSLKANCWRTWIYCRDIDNHYAGMVDARKKHFAAEGMTEATRYIASTGIEAKSLKVNSLMTMDALAMAGLESAQAERMEAPDNMCPTHVYGVTFERGQTLKFGDRTHHHISGTASIDRNGDVLFPNDVVRQTDCALDNVEALLAAKGAGLCDMAYFIVYMRNPSEVIKVRDALYRRVSRDAPILFVEGAVCRPSWLVEVEGMAIASSSHPYPDFL